MAKNAGEGKGATKNIAATRSVEAQNDTRRRAKARRKHAGSGSQAPTTSILTQVAQERRERNLKFREQQAQHQENIQLQVALALLFIAQRARMTTGERLIAEAVVKAFVSSVKSGTMSRTAVAKDKVRKVWENNPSLQARITEKELRNGLSIGGSDLFKAGKEVFENAPAVDTNTTDTPVLV